MSGQWRAPSAGLAMIMAWLAIFSSWQRRLMLASVPRTIFSIPGQLAFCTTTMGASSGQPAARSARCTSCSSVIDRKMHSVVRCAASASRSSPAGIGVRPATRVRMTVCVTSGRVRVSPAAAAEAIADDTPGTTFQSMPAASSGRVISTSAPYRPGSPVCRRTTVRWRAQASSSQTLICSSVMSLESRISQPLGAWCVAVWSTSEPANRIAPACSSRRRPFTVMRSGSPGPAPTNQTVPTELPLPAFISHAPARQSTVAPAGDVPANAAA